MRSMEWGQLFAVGAMVAMVCGCQQSLTAFCKGSEGKGLLCLNATPTSGADSQQQRGKQAEEPQPLANAAAVAAAAGAAPRGSVSNAPVPEAEGGAAISDQPSGAILSPQTPMPEQSDVQPDIPFTERVSGADLYDLCRKPSQDARCTGYVEAVADTLGNGQSLYGEYRACIPAEINVKQLKAAVVDYLEPIADHGGDRPGADLVAIALAGKYPCKATP